MVNANRYLKRRTGRNRSGERWYLQVPVPKELRPRLGRSVERALHTGDPRVARIRRDAALPEIHALFARARAEPTLAEVIAAARREELARAGAIWSEAVLDRGPAAVRTALAALIDAEHIAGEPEAIPAPSEAWQRRARRALLHHGLEPTLAAIGEVAEALLAAHIEAAEAAIDGRPALTPAEPRTEAPPPRGVEIPPDPRSPVLAMPAGHARKLEMMADRYLAEREGSWTGQTKVQVRATLQAFTEHVASKSPSEKFGLRVKRLPSGGGGAG
jgi:hypothetical protein